MEPIKCLVVDDEPLGRDILIRYIAQTPQLELAGICKDAFEAARDIVQKDVDLIFLDIQMPKLSGLSLVKSLPRSPKIIFVTAYPEYAVEGFEVNAIDYLVKPVSMERFMKAVNKAGELIRKEISGNDFIFLKVDKKLLKVKLNDIFYIEAFGDYLKVHTSDKVHVVADTMKNFEKQLPERNFLRIHKSFIINIEVIEFLEGNQVSVNKKLLPIGGTYKEELSKRIKN